MQKYVALFAIVLVAFALAAPAFGEAPKPDLKPAEQFYSSGYYGGGYYPSAYAGYGGYGGYGLGYGYYGR
jgi:hypothetical protein